MRERGSEGARRRLPRKLAPDRDPGGALMRYVTNMLGLRRHSGLIRMMSATLLILTALMATACGSGAPASKCPKLLAANDNRQGPQICFGLRKPNPNHTPHDSQYFQAWEPGVFLVGATSDDGGFAGSNAVTAITTEIKGIVQQDVSAISG